MNQSSERSSRLLTTQEACKALRCGKTFLFELLKDGELRAVKLGSRTMIPRDAINAFIGRLPAVRQVAP